MHKLRTLLKPLTAMLVGLTVGIISLPAQAAPVTIEYQLNTNSQHLSVSADIEVAPISRDGYGVTIMAVWPTNGHELTDCFGCRGGEHEGIDISYSGINGTPVYAVSSGCIDVAGWDGSYGNQVVMSNPYFGVQTRYAHMIDGSLQVGAGQCVVAGQILGLVGSTGNSSGPHLHFEVLVGGVPIDPLGWLVANTF